MEPYEGNIDLSYWPCVPVEALGEKQRVILLIITSRATTPVMASQNGVAEKEPVKVYLRLRPLDKGDGGVETEKVVTVVGQKKISVTEDPTAGTSWEANFDFVSSSSQSRVGRAHCTLFSQYLV